MKLIFFLLNYDIIAANGFKIRFTYLRPRLEKQGFVLGDLRKSTAVFNALKNNRTGMFTRIQLDHCEVNLHDETTIFTIT